MNDIHPMEFAREWESAWNRRDVEAVLRHFHEDAVFTSPLAQRVGAAADGVLKGKDAIRRYWQTALAQSQSTPAQFQVNTVYEGVNSIVIAFTITAREQRVDRVEVLSFRDGLVIEGHGTFAAS